MKKIFSLFVIAFLFVAGISTKKISAASITYTEDDYNRLKKVIEHIDNVLLYGRAVNPNTKLLPDGIDTLTGEPARWIFPNGYDVAFSDMANQQNFLRALVGLSTLTGNEKYKNEAIDTLKEFIDNYQSPQGLFYWGGHRTIDLERIDPTTGKLTIQSTESPSGPHELKNMMPFYELFLEVNEEATIRFMQQLWTAHYVWDTTDMNRHGSFTIPYDENVFTRDIPDDVIKMGEDGRPIIPNDSPGKLPFVNTATDLAYAAFFIYDKTNDPLPKNWAEYLMRQYNLASDPVTGMTVYQFKSTEVQASRAALCKNPAYTNSGCGDRVARQFRDFGSIAREANVGWKNTQAIYVDNILMMLEAAEKFGIDYFVDWSRKYLEGYLNYAYIRDKQQNKIIPMFIDGTVTYGYTTPEGGYFGPSGMTIGYVDMPTTYILPILRTILNTKKDSDKLVLWDYLRQILYTVGIGDIGKYGDKNPALDFSNAVDDPFALISMIELYEDTGNVNYLNVARTIGNNIIANKFHRGFLVDAEPLRYARLDSPIALALLNLDAACRGIKLSEMPYYLADSGYIHGYMLNGFGNGETRDYSNKSTSIFLKTIND